MKWLVVSVTILFAIASDIRTAHACAAAPPRGEEVRIAEEEALIVWDPATKTEQFIRRAGFRSTARQFGFLVPTPTLPKLSEVSDSIFYTLTEYIRRPIEYTHPKKYEAGSWLFEACMLTKGASDDARQVTAEPPVRVLQTANVAGFEATTVEADDPKALTDWLGNHGFEATPQLTAWLERYVSDHWKITAFVVGAKDAQSDRYDIATKAVNMTFPADKPFYPYREPKIEMTVESTAKLAPVNDRVLRVFFVSDARYAATMNNEPWSAKVLQAEKLAAPSDELAALFGKQRYMTTFVDESSPRRGIEELYFAPSADKSDVRQPVQKIEWPEKVTIPIDAIVLGVLVVFWVVRRVKKPRK